MVCLFYYHYCIWTMYATEKNKQFMKVDSTLKICVIDKQLLPSPRTYTYGCFIVNRTLRSSVFTYGRVHCRAKGKAICTRVSVTKRCYKKELPIGIKFKTFFLIIYIKLNNEITKSQNPKTKQNSTNRRKHTCLRLKGTYILYSCNNWPACSSYTHKYILMSVCRICSIPILI